MSSTELVLVIPLKTTYWRESYKKIEEEEVCGRIAVNVIEKEDFNLNTSGHFVLPKTEQLNRRITGFIYSEVNGSSKGWRTISSHPNKQLFFEYDGWVYLDKTEEGGTSIHCIVECPTGDCGRWIIDNCGWKHGKTDLYFGKEVYILPSSKFCAHQGCLRCMCSWCFENCAEDPNKEWYCSKHIFTHVVHT